MGFVVFLNFGLKCFHLLAWPLLALGYPLCASIRAIETNSNYHIRKLVTYWILFSLISLFELAFAKLIEWVPLWSYIKLGAICWLVLPQFRGAHCCYRGFVHRCLTVNLEDVQRRLNKRQEASLEEKSFLSVAERYVIQNGTGALMKLIASKGSMTQFGVEEMKVVAEAEKKEMHSTSNLNEFNTSQKDTNREELQEKNASSGVKLVKSADAYLVRTEKKTIGAVKVKEATLPAAVAEKELWEHLRKVQKEWTCAVCQVKTCSEADLNSHLGGRKHKDKCEELKLKVRATKQTSKFKAVSSSPEAVAEKELWEHLRKVKKDWTCAVCQVKTCSEADLNSHLGGRKHKDKCEELNLKVRATKQTSKYKAVSSSPASKGTRTNQDSMKPVSRDGSSEDKFRKQEEKVQVNAKTELYKHNTSTSCNSGSVSLEGWCPYCEITCSREMDFLSHLNGKKHLARVQERVQEVAGYTAGVQGRDNAGFRADAQGWDSLVNTTGAQGWDYSALTYGWS